MSNPKHTLRIPADLHDEWLRKLSLGEWALFSAILRKTYGFDKMQDTVSTSQLMEMTGLSERSVQRYMTTLLNSGAPVEVVCRVKNGTTYHITEPHSDKSSGMQEHARSCNPTNLAECKEPSLLQSDYSGGMRRGFTSIPTNLAPTTDTPKEYKQNRTDGGIGTVSVPEPVCLEGHTSVNVNQSPAEEVVARMPTDTSKPFEEEDGLVVEGKPQDMNLHTSQDHAEGNVSVSVSVHPQDTGKGFGLEGQTPMEINKQKQMSVVSKRTGKRYILGVQDAEYVADVLQIRVKDARGIMHDCPGANGYQVLCVVNRDNVATAKNPAGYLHTVVKANVSKILAQNPFPQGHKANNQPKATKQTSPVPRHPSFAEKQAPAAPKAAAKPVFSTAATDKLDAAVLEAFEKLGVTGGNGKYTLVELGTYFKSSQTGLAHLCHHLNDMRLRNLIALDGAGLYSVVAQVGNVGLRIKPETIQEPVPAAAAAAPVVEIKVEIPEPAAVTVEEPAPLPFDPFEVVMADFERVVPPAPVEPIPAPAWLDEPSTEPDEPTVDCDDVFTRDREPTIPDQLDVSAIRAQHDADQQATRDAEHDANMARLNQEMAQAALAKAPAEIKIDIPAPTVEVNSEPPQHAPLTERITWHIQHGVRDVSVLMKVCGRNYDAVIRAVTILKQKGIIHMVDGGWRAA